VIYAIGSKVVYPSHGAGTIVSIQKKSLGDVTRTYYVIDTLSSGQISSDRQLMIPVPRAESAGLRFAGRASDLRRTLSCCAAPCVDDIETDYRARQATVREMIGTGSFRSVADAVTMLYTLNCRRPLGITDRQLLDRGKQILAGELAVAADLEMHDAMDELEHYLENTVATAEDQEA